MQYSISEEVKKEHKTDSSQRIAFHALQKQLQNIKLKEWLLMFGFIGGAALLRVPMQAFPSAEPITFFALLAGMLFGKRKGLFVGVSALYLSNFVTMGGQGLWTFFQAIGFGGIGFLGGFLRKKASILEIVTVVTLGTVFFEIVVNLGSAIVFPFTLGGIFLSAIPFGIVHLFSNLIFCSLLPSFRKFIEKKGKFNEREVCEKLIKNFNSKIGNNNIQKTKNIIQKFKTSKLFKLFNGQEKEIK